MFALYSKGASMIAKQNSNVKSKVASIGSSREEDKSELSFNFFKIMRPYGHSGVRNKWKAFFSCAQCGDGIHSNLRDCCPLHASLPFLGFLIKDVSCWMRFLFLVLFLLILFFVLYRLLSELWRFICPKKGACDDILKTEENCKKLKKILKQVKSSSDEVIHNKNETNMKGDEKKGNKSPDIKASQVKELDLPEAEGNRKTQNAKYIHIRHEQEENSNRDKNQPDPINQTGSSPNEQKIGPVIDRNFSHGPNDLEYSQPELYSDAMQGHCDANCCCNIKPCSFCSCYSDMRYCLNPSRCSRSTRDKFYQTVHPGNERRSCNNNIHGNVTEDSLEYIYCRREESLMNPRTIALNNTGQRMEATIQSLPGGYPQDRFNARNDNIMDEQDIYCGNANYIENIITRKKCQYNMSPRGTQKEPAMKKTRRLLVKQDDNIRPQFDTKDQVETDNTATDNKVPLEVTRPLKLIIHHKRGTQSSYNSQHYRGNGVSIENKHQIAGSIKPRPQNTLVSKDQRKANHRAFENEASSNSLDRNKNLDDRSNQTSYDETTDTGKNINEPDNIKPESKTKNKKSRGKQSPVDIKLEDCLPLYFDEPLVWYCYTNIPISMKISNWNETVAVSGVWNAKETPCISGGPLLSDVYLFDKLVFKWGACDHTGSEHATDSKFYPLERQMIFRRDSNSVYSILEQQKSCNNPDCIIKHCNELHTGFQLQDNQCLTQCRPHETKGNDRRSGNNLEYVIISSFYEIFDCDPYSRNVCLDNILKYVRLVQNSNTSHSIPVFSLDLIQEPFNCNYFSYFGSLTFPPHTENVLWIIQPDISFVSKQQMESLREIKSEKGDKILSNRRSIQPLNKRCIYLCC